MRIRSLFLALSLVTGTFAASTAHGEAPTLDKGSKQLAPGQASGGEEVASAEGGVHLLEHILQRMRNLPQLAISKTKQTIAFQSQAQSAIFEPNQAANLLIKPKDLPRAQKAKMVPGAGVIASTGAMIRSGSSMAGAGGGFGGVGDGFTNADETSTVDQSKNRAISGWERQEAGQSADEGDKIANLVPGIGRVREYSLNDQEEKSFKEERNKKIISTAPLITEFSSHSQLPATQSSSLSPAADQAAPPSERRPAKASAKKGAWSSPGNLPISSPQPGGFSAGFGGSSGASGYTRGSRLDGIHLDDARTPPPPQVQGKLLAKRPSGPGLPASNYGRFVGTPGDNLYGEKLYYDRKIPPLNRLKADVPGRDLDIALTPPTVITGITLVRLGNSEKEAARSIASLGKAHKELIHGWSVWSIQKRDCKDCSIQIFLRHGIVEAIRIFDPTLLRPELGVTLGDCLSAVKEKFGEPAFILSEASGPTTQNYIYPISQVGFQLARSKQNDAPKIVSMIVFNVK